MRSALRCTWTAMLERIALSGVHLHWWNQPAPPSASHEDAWLGVVFRMEWYCCKLTPGKSQSWTLYLATLGGYFWPWCSRTLPNPSPVAGCLAFACSSPPEISLPISLKTSPPAAHQSIRHYHNYPKAIISRMLSNNPQQLSPNAVVQIFAVWISSTPRLWTDTFSRATQPPTHSSPCWMDCGWPAPSFWQITSRRIQFSSG